MSELHGSSAEDGDDPGPADVSQETNEADQYRETPDSRDAERPGEDEEPLSRSEYADMMHDQAAAEDDDSDHSSDSNGDGHDDQEDPAASEASGRAELPEPRTRQEVAEEPADDSTEPETDPHDDQAANANLEASIAEQDKLPEPRTRQEVADQERSGTDPLTAANAQTEQHGEHELLVPTTQGHEAPITVVQAGPEDRTLGDTTPAGTGLRPTGDQLFHMEADDPAESRTDRLFGKAFELMDDVHDMTGHIAEAIQEDLPHGAGSPPLGHSAYVVHEQPTPPPDAPGIGDVVGSITVIGVMTVVGFRRLLSHRMRGQRA
jgi:hypothetical protein